MSPFWMLNVLNSAELVLGQYQRLQHSPPSTVVPTLMGPPAVSKGQCLTPETRGQPSTYQSSAGPALANQPVA